MERLHFVAFQATVIPPELSLWFPTDVTAKPDYLTLFLPSFLPLYVG